MRIVCGASSPRGAENAGKTKATSKVVGERRFVRGVEAGAGAGGVRRDGLGARGGQHIGRNVNVAVSRDPTGVGN